MSCAPDLHAILSASMNDLQWALYFCNLKGKRERNNYWCKISFFFLSNGWVIIRRFWKAVQGACQHWKNFWPREIYSQTAPVIMSYRPFGESCLEKHWRNYKTSLNSTWHTDFTIHTYIPLCTDENIENYMLWIKFKTTYREYMLHRTLQWNPISIDAKGLEIRKWM